MHNLAEYIDRIMQKADLAHDDEERVREELTDHLLGIIEVGEKQAISEEDVMREIERQFGNSQDLGDSIAKAKGRFRTYLKKEARKMPIIAVVAIILALGIRTFWLHPFRASTDVISPTVCKGDLLVVNKLTEDFRADDIVVFKEKNRAIIGVVKEAGKNSIDITRGAQDERTVAKELVIGRVVSQLRRREDSTVLAPTNRLCLAEIILLLAGLSMWGAGKAKKRPGLEHIGQYVLYAWFIIAVIYALFLFT